MSQQILFRRDTTVNWTATNPILAQGEIGIDLTLNRLKIGDGSTHWNLLAFYSTGNGDMLAANNLSDLADFATARSNLGLGTAATANTGDFDAVGTATSEVGAHVALSDPHTQYLKKSSDLSDLSNITTAKTNLALENVNNTSDANKPVSTAQQTALDFKANLASPTFTGTVSGITKSMVGLSNVDNTSDATKNSAAVALTNHTIDASLNTISNITTAMLSAGVLDIDISSTSASDDTIPSAKATKSYIDTQDDLKVSKAGDSMSGNLVMGTNKITGLAAGSASNDAVNYAQLSAVAAGLVWHSPVQDPDLIDANRATVPSSPSYGDVYIASATIGVFTIGHAYFSIDAGVNWVDLLGRAVIVGDRFGISVTSTTAAVGVLSGKDHELATVTDATPGSVAFSYDSLTAGQAFFVNQDNSSHAGHQYTYDGIDWIEFGGAAAISPGVGLSFSSNVLNVNLGAGIVQLPSDEVGIDVHSDGGVDIIDPSTGLHSTASNAQLSLKLNGTTLALSSSGVKVAALGVTNAEIATAAAIDQSKISGLVSALSGKEATITATTSADYYRGDKTFQTLNKAAVGLSNVDDTSDANKPVSTAQQTALNLKVTANPAITGATFTKITYDAMGLVTSGANIAASDLPTGIDAAKIDGGTVTNAEFGYLAGTLSPIQTQINGKVPTTRTVNGQALSSNITVTGGLNKQVQYNSSNVLAGAANVTIDNSDLTLASNASPISPPAANVKLFGRSVANRILPAFVGPSGLDSCIQPFMARNKIGYWTPQGNATTVPGIFGLAAPAIAGTATARNVATTNIVTRMKRLAYVSANGTGSLASHYITVGQFSTGTGAGLGGFTFITRFAVSDAATVSGARHFCGVSSTIAAPTNVDPSTLTNSIGIAQIAGDATQWYIVYGGSAAQTPIALGIGLGAPTLTTTAWELALFSSPNENSIVYYQVTNLGTGTIVTGTLSGIVGTAVPASTTLLAYRQYRTNNATGLAVGIDICSIYIETDY